MRHGDFITVALVLLFSVISIFTVEAGRLSEHIGEYKGLDYNQDSLRNRHSITRRSVYDKVIKLDIKAFGRKFNLRLYPDTDTFHPQAEYDSDGVVIPLDTSHLFKGHVEGDPNSKVYGAIIDGVFRGRIELGNGDAYQVEKKEHYRENKDLMSNSKVHSLIYHDKEVDVDGFLEKLRSRRSADSEEAGTCGNSMKETYDWMKRVQRSVIDEPVEEGFSHQEGDNPWVRRDKRAAESYTTCNLFLQGDPQLWRYYSGLYGSEDAESQIREEITAMFHEHVNNVKGIYEATSFTDPDTGFSHRRYGFRVDRVQINKTCSGNEHAFCNAAIDASNLLNLNSYNNHDKYCLAYLFTYRDFDGGTLGLAWVAEPGKVGGICSKHKRIQDGNFVATRSLNTGIVTLNNYAKTVPPRVSYITLAHEIGHNFGSNHDPESSSCTPFTTSGSSDGNFIMFASATTGTKPNNNRFSQCSIDSIGRVLTSVKNEKNGHQDCFKESGGPWCGNQIKEDMEKCDCGYMADCPGGANSRECCPCCYGQNQDNNDPLACTLKTSFIDATGASMPVKCDPSQGPCCSDTCQFISDTSKICAPKTDCTQVAYCSGAQATCPLPVNEPDNTPCNGNTQICHAGECSGSICSLIEGKWFECSPLRMNQDRSDTSLCYLSCTKDNITCHTSANYTQADFPPEFKRLLEKYSNATAIPLAPGSACDMNKGFCDHFQKCRMVNVKGPLARLKDLLFSESSLLRVKAWVTEYWWGVALSIIGLIALMVLFVKCFAVHTPSSNPNQPKRRQLSQTLTLRRRRANQGAAAPSAAANRGGAGDFRQSQPQRDSRGAPPPYEYAANIPPSSSRNNQQPRTSRDQVYELK